LSATFRHGSFYFFFSCLSFFLFLDCILLIKRHGENAREKEEIKDCALKLRLAPVIISFFFPRQYILTPSGRKNEVIRAGEPAVFNVAQRMIVRERISSKRIKYRKDEDYFSLTNAALQQKPESFLLTTSLPLLSARGIRTGGQLVASG